MAEQGKEDAEYKLMKALSEEMESVGFIDKYILIREIGTGASCTVYQAIHS